MKINNIINEAYTTSSQRSIISANLRSLADLMDKATDDEEFKINQSTLDNLYNFSRYTVPHIINNYESTEKRAAIEAEKEAAVRKKAMEKEMSLQRAAHLKLSPEFKNFKKYALKTKVEGIPGLRRVFDVTPVNIDILEKNGTVNRYAIKNLSSNHLEAITNVAQAYVNDTNGAKTSYDPLFSTLRGMQENDIPFKWGYYSGGQKQFLVTETYELFLDTKAKYISRYSDRALLFFKVLPNGKLKIDDKHELSVNQVAEIFHIEDMINYIKNSYNIDINLIIDEDYRQYFRPIGDNYINFSIRANLMRGEDVFVRDINSNDIDSVKDLIKLIYRNTGSNI